MVDWDQPGMTRHGQVGVRQVGTRQVGTYQVSLAKRIL